MKNLRSALLFLLLAGCGDNLETNSVVNPGDPVPVPIAGNLTAGGSQIGLLFGGCNGLTTNVNPESFFTTNGTTVEAFVFAGQPVTFTAQANIRPPGLGGTRRTLNLEFTDADGIRVGDVYNATTRMLANPGSIVIEYAETNGSVNPPLLRLWESVSGTATVTRFDNNVLGLTFANLQLSPVPSIDGNSAIGDVCASGTATINATSRALER